MNLSIMYKILEIRITPYFVCFLIEVLEGGLKIQKIQNSINDRTVNFIS